MSLRDPAAIDVGELNAATTALYDVAYKRGLYDGREQATADLARRHARSLLELLDPILAAALVETGDDRRRSLALARMVLGRTPMVGGAVIRSIDLLGHGNRHPEHRDVDDAQVREVLELVRAAVEELPQ